MRIWLVDAFADHVFAGATVAVVPLDRWPSDDVMMAVASQNRVAETAFLVAGGLKGAYQLRWFTAQGEMPMSGEAALAAGFVLLTELEPGLDVVVFDTMVGPIVVREAPDGYTIDLPRRMRMPWSPTADLLGALAPMLPVEDAFAGEHATIVVDCEDTLAALKPDIRAIDKLVRGPRQGCLTVTAKADVGRDYDFVARVFTPGKGVAEDPASGAALADLAPYWCDRLGVDAVIGKQLSRRGALVAGRQTLHSARLTGRAQVYLRGEVDAAAVRQIGFEQPAPPAAVAAPPVDDLLVTVAADAADAADAVLVFDLDPCEDDVLHEAPAIVAEPAPDLPANDLSNAFPGGLARR